MFGLIPAYGFYMRHVRGITVTDVEVSFMKDDLRPPFILDDVKGADFHRIKAQHLPSGEMFFEERLGFLNKPNLVTPGCQARVCSVEFDVCDVPTIKNAF